MSDNQDPAPELDTEIVSDFGELPEEMVNSDGPDSGENVGEPVKEKKARKPRVAKEKAPRKPRANAGGPRAPRKPTFKDWIRVIHSQGSTCENVSVHLVINEATNIATLVTVAPKVEGSDEMEEPRRQIFKITGFEVINVAAVEETAEAPAETAN